MSSPLKAPTFPESIEDGLVATWHKQVGDSFLQDEVLVEIETDKVILEVVAPKDGQITQIIQDEGSTILSEALLAEISFTFSQDKKHAQPIQEANTSSEIKDSLSKDINASPSVRQLIHEKMIPVNELKGTGKNGLILKEDVLNYLNVKMHKNTQKRTSPNSIEVPLDGHRVERREPMSRLRAKIASRLVEAQHNMAMLTTFNEVNMQPIMSLRSRYKEEFEKKHETRLGFMSFFVKSAVEALKTYPIVNASIEENDVIYHSYQDIGVAVSSSRGLVVPILKDVNQMSLATIESTIRTFGEKAQKGKLSMDELTGGTFTISNGGVFGSLMSTPIVNPPQTAILGMHKIQERPVAVNGKVVILPMMYLALSYDHRLIDGKEAVSFLVHIKKLLEAPERLLLGL
jgi:2-oxoglutarate dehydrogenase E2 component (dihydrolipoamide succinyltransferase)